MLRLKNLGVLLSILIVISCTIVKDSDITSLDQFNKLFLKSIEIDQNAQAGNSTTLAVLKYDSSVNRISGSTGAHVSRVKAFSLPALGNRKMKLKSGANVATEIDIGYRDNGSLNACFIFQGDSAIESYRFFYNTSNQLIKVVTILDPVDGKARIYQAKDTIIYPPVGVSTYPATINRKSPVDATLNRTFTLSACTSCSTPDITSINVQLSSSNYQINFNSGNCHDSGQNIYNCGGVNNNSFGGNQSNGNAQLNFQSNVTFNKTLETTITSQNATDTYYFHPIMILKDAVPQGGFYFWFYSIDWFQTTSATNTNDDIVKIKFNYAQ